MIKIILPIIFTAITIPNAGMAAITVRKCLTDSDGFSQAECATQCTSGKYCCPTCYVESETQTCPSGWTLGENMLGDVLCMRSDNTIVSNDTAGYKKQNYGSCTPTTTTNTTYRYSISNTDKIASGGQSLCLVCI